MIDHLDGFFNDFAIAATLPSGAVVRGLLDTPSSQPLGIMNTAPTFTAKSIDVASLSAGNTITVASAAYTVRAIEPDGTGISVLTLEKV
jgi:hypothetical protein